MSKRFPHYISVDLLENICLRKTYSKLFVFDIDSTLYSESSFIPDYFEALTRSLSDYLDITLKEAKEIFLQGDKFKYGGVHKCFQKYNLPSTFFYTLFSKYLDTSKIFEKDLQLIEILNTMKYPLICLTNASEPHARSVLSALSIENVFEYVIYTEPYRINSLRKPMNEVFKNIEETFQISNKNIYFFDDFYKNIEAAELRGWNSFTVTKKENIKDLLLKILKSL